ncbi:proximal sequence element A Pbp49 [Anticarsia gemmatalis]|uniref:proximal sequence element A Pbp49 n=1 Tax=Anticarsia gemmatalis TaxID=129554 RepID=UPI003F7721BF
MSGTEKTPADKINLTIGDMCNQLIREIDSGGVQRSINEQECAFPSSPTVIKSLNMENVKSGVLKVGEKSGLDSTVTYKLNDCKPSTSYGLNTDPRTDPGTEEFDQEPFNRKRVKLFTADTGPQMYAAKGNLVTRPIITKNLPEVFQYLPVYGKPGPHASLQEFYRNKVREYVGCDLNDDEFKDLETFCSPDLLKTGREIKMQTNVPVMGLLHSNLMQSKIVKPATPGEPPNLVILKKNKIRLENDSKGLFTKKLKYRGVRVLQYSQEENPEPPKNSTSEPDVDLEPGTDILYRVRIYRPYTYNMAKDRFTRSRHSVYCCDVLLTGRHRLSALRDRIVCHNDFDLRVDVSENPDVLPTTTAKEVFPSGFLFINNVFYVDTREGCIDYSEPIRKWARERKKGNFPKMDMCQVRLDELVLKLGYPEVYVHQGNCEHVFVFSEVRLLHASDPLRFSNYPCSTSIAQNQTVYCTTCAEFSAKWIVVGSDRVPFDPGFFCDTCFKQYMYIDGKKIGNFKAYRYRGNALNVLKPQ